MKIMLLAFTLIFYSLPQLSIANLSSDLYLKYFQRYEYWSEHLPNTLEPQFLTIISTNTPLANKLRERWLYLLAQNQDWAHYSLYYKPSTDVTLQCFAARAHYEQGHIEFGLQIAQKLWLKPYSAPPGCTKIFTYLKHSHYYTQTLIQRRLFLALRQHNAKLSQYLLQELRPISKQDSQIFAKITQNPHYISQLQSSSLHQEFYLYGLRQLLENKRDQAVKLWKNPHTQHLLNTSQQQLFLADLAYHKAIHQDTDTAHWFNKVHKAYYNEALLDWQIRYAISQQNWPAVIRIIHLHPDNHQPIWQYWLARALYATHHTHAAHMIYTHLATLRHYYGFLASYRLHTKPQFHLEPHNTHLQLIQPYRQFLHEIQQLHHNNQHVKASMLLNDFITELPAAQQSALIYWLETVLHWHGKSVYLSNTKALHNQLNLRFPLAYQHTIQKNAQHYKVPESLVYAIIRQESAFREEVTSAAGAQGLMQIMPSTARLVAHKEKIDLSRSNKNILFNTEKNIQLGVATLKNLAPIFHNHPLLMAAAYNAGPKQVRQWLAQYPHQSMDIWIETLPWRETRDYLKNITAFYTVYNYRLHKPINIENILKPISNSK